MTGGLKNRVLHLFTLAIVSVQLTACASTQTTKPPYPTKPPTTTSSACTAANTVTAQVVALDSAIIANRMGAMLPDAMIFALKGDVEPTDSASPTDWTKWNAGKVALKAYKRARPLVLRMNKGQCLTVEFRNLVADSNNVPAVPAYTNCTANSNGKCCPNPTAAPDSSDICQSSQPTTRAASLHVQGLNWLTGPGDDGSWVGTNASSQRDPGQPVNPGDPAMTYRLYAPEEGPFLLYSTGDVFSGIAVGPSGAGSPNGGDGGQLQQGLFGALTVEPKEAEYYRSQVTAEDLCLATVGHTWAGNVCTPPAGPRKIDYQTLYPAGHAREGQPVLRLVKKRQDGGWDVVHSDLTAIITGPGAGPFNDATAPGHHIVATSPDRLEPFREFTIIYHEMFRARQGFWQLYQDSQLKNSLESVNDNFAINYGMGGIGSEILANRFSRGPAADCLDCKYEEFFLSSWTNGDPAMVVNPPADEGCNIADTAAGYTTFQCPEEAVDLPQKRTALYPDDPSNVYHGYLWDHTKFRILHGGSDLHHVHHLHAHQWLHSPDTSSGHYLDSQTIGPGAAFTLEMVYNGSGNKNLTVGDSIFHCHFYPHFAAGMWALWRVHDVFEAGTQLDAQGKPVAGSRALPDGAIAAGTPIPAVVPVPTRPMAPDPAPVRLADDGKKVEICADAQETDCISNLAADGDPAKYKNPGYPFFVPGIAGTRAVHPPLDFALACSGSGEACDKIGVACAGVGGTCQALDGGLPRHLVAAAPQVNGTNILMPAVNPLDYSKEVIKADGIGLPEDGTVVEKVAMTYHGLRLHPSTTPKGVKKDFVTNGHPARPGAPYADPCIDIDGTIPQGLRDINYWGVDFQTDAVFNKEGWHYPQQRMISLWGDLFDYLGLKGGQKKAPEPFFIRANSNDCVHYRMANLIPKTYELDDFQVRTPTDILGQHIHLVKFDVTSSDGGANGFNYEDGTLAPDEVVERINAFNNGSWTPARSTDPKTLTPTFIKYFGADPTCVQNPTSPACQCQVVEYQHGGKTLKGVKGGRWCGAQATFQLWYVDPTLNDAGDDMTLRTVFTHDHFGPSTHQQAGVYAALVSEPAGSTWHNNETGTPLGDRTASQNGVNLKDGGPTSWQAVIKTNPVAGSFREFVMALQDSTLMYRPFPAYPLPACPAGQVCGFCSTDHTQACSTDPTSTVYWEDVCTREVSLPNPNTGGTAQPGSPSTLLPSCNYVAGIPANASLFSSLVSGSKKGNVFGVTSGTQWDALQTIGWGDQSSTALPIDPGPKGLFVAGQSTQTTAAQPEGIILDGATTNFSVSYRNEPIYPRLWANGATTPGDTSSVYRSANRTLPGAQPPVYAPLTPGVGAGDPFTPLLRAQAGDNVQVRLVVGAHQNPHNFAVNGLKWLFEPSNVNSGWRSTQTMGISEHFEFLFRVPGQIQQPGADRVLPTADYLYKATAAKQGQTSGNWGILRAYNTQQADLFPVPGTQPPAPMGVCPAALQNAQCGATDGKGHTLRCYDVVAATAASLLGSNGIVYNTKLGWNSPGSLLYVLADDYQKLVSKQAVPGINPTTGLAEPLVLRAGAGDCIKVTLANRIPKGATLAQGFASGQIPADGISSLPANNRGLFVPSTVSPEVGLHPQLVSYDVTNSDGYNVGDNMGQTVAPMSGSTPATKTYWWYAGNIDPQKGYIPVEFGAVNLLPSDPINHHPYSLFAALVVEPEGATWTTDPNSRASATVTAGTTSFREQVLMLQDDGVIFTASGTRQGGGGFGGFNYRTEPLNGATANTRVCSDASSVACVFSNSAVCNGGTCGFSTQVPSETPTFCAKAGQQARIRLLHPGGAVTNNVFELNGHTFAEEPYLTRKANCSAPVTHTNPLASQVIQVGNECPDGNVALGPSLTEWKGSRSGHGPTNHFDLVIEKAGGKNAVAGDYLYRSFPAPHVGSGIWGIFRVTPGDPTAASCPSFQQPGS
jgi:hypothetical protein